MDNMNSRNTQPQVWHGFHHNLVNRMSALASAKDKHIWPRGWGTLAGNLEESFANWNAGHFIAPKISSRLGKVHSCSRDHGRNHAVGKPRNKVRLENQRGNSTYYCRQHRRAGGVSADTDHDIGLIFRKYALRVPNRVREIEDSLQPGLKAHPVQGANLDETQRKSGGGNQAILNAAGGADEKHVSGVVPLELLGDSQRGDHVSACPTPRQNSPHAVDYKSRH